MGACKTDCKSLVMPPTCTGTQVAKMNCSDIVTTKPSTECEKYYNIMNQQCAYDSKTNLCMNSNGCIMPAQPTPVAT